VLLPPPQLATPRASNRIIAASVTPANPAMRAMLGRRLVQAKPIQARKSMTNGTRKGTGIGPGPRWPTGGASDRAVVLAVSVEVAAVWVVGVTGLVTEQVGSVPLNPEGVATEQVRVTALLKLKALVMLRGYIAGLPATTVLVVVVAVRPKSGFKAIWTELETGLEV